MQISIPHEYFQLSKTILHLTIELGTPSKNCANFGICRIQLQSRPPLLDRQQCLCNTAGTLELLNENLIQFRFPFEQLCPKCEAKHFSGRYFRMEEAFDLPPEILEELSLTAFQINVGWYRITVDSIGYIVQFHRGQLYYFGL